MGEKNPASLKGHFIVAMPQLPDPNFSKSVTCICEHVPAGSMGIVINRIHPVLTGKSVFEELKIDYIPMTESLPIRIGGPVHLNEIMILHNDPTLWEGSLQITPTLAMSNTRNILEAIAQGNGPESSMIFIGCAGWGQGQLEHEIMQNSWLTCPVSDEVIFDIPVAECWEETIKKMGVDPSMLTNTAGHA